MAKSITIVRLARKPPARPERKRDAETSHQHEELFARLLAELERFEWEWHRLQQAKSRAHSPQKLARLRREETALAKAHLDLVKVGEDALLAEREKALFHDATLLRARREATRRFVNGLRPKRSECDERKRAKLAPQVSLMVESVPDAHDPMTQIRQMRTFSLTSFVSEDPSI